MAKRRGKRRGRRLPPRSASGRFLKRGARRVRRRTHRRVKRRQSFMRRYRRKASGGGFMGKYATNPRRRRSRRRSNPRRRYRRHRNPSMRLNLNNIVGMLTTATLGAAGAIVVEKGLTYLPAGFASTALSGQMRYVTKAGASILLGVVGGMFGAKAARWAATMAAGSLTVTMYEALQAEILPKLGIAGLGYWGSGYVAGEGGPGMGLLGDAGMGEYVGASAGMQGLGEYVH